MHASSINTRPFHPVLRIPPSVCVLQVWYTAVASETGDSGVITNVVKSNTGSAQGKLVIEAVHILGVPKTAPSTILEAAPLPQVRLNGQTLDTGYDAAAGVIKLTGLSIPVAEPLQLRWRI
jgi:hypothetical protein